MRTLIRRDVVESTSDLARRLVTEGSPALPLVVRADRQTRGRGRGDHAWWSDAGSLTFTLALDPTAHGLRPEHEPRLALVAAVALIDAIRPLAPAAPLGIRWPNDVEADGRKLAGILPERVDAPDGPRLLIGIGVNVRNDLDRAPAEIRRMATTVERLRGSPLTGDGPESFLGALLTGLDGLLDQLARDRPELPLRWGRLDTLRGRPIRVDVGPRILAGLGGGIDARGGLILLDGPESTTLFGGQVLRDPA